jgi:hypothetical protein
MKSIVYFTTHKCASTFLAYFLQRMSHLIKMNCVDHSHKIWTHHQNPVHHPTGHIYGPYRRYHPLKNIDDYKLVLNIRDVRDVLTSQYFSVAYSHALPTNPVHKKNFLLRRKNALNSTIDEFVLENSQLFLTRYQDYQKLYDNHDVLLLRYEEMILDFPSWVNKFLKHCEIEVDKRGYSILMEYNQFKPKKENIKSNKRQVSSGNHKKKLQPETIEKLNSLFEHVPIALYEQG